MSKLAIKGQHLRDSNADAVRFSKYLDDKYECSGYCFDTLFGYSTHIDDGKREGTCVDGVKKELYLVFSFPAITALIA